MNNKEWVAKFCEPECVVGLGIDWSGYIPSGGWEWQDNFRKTVIPRIDEVLSGLNGEKSKYDGAKIEYDELSSGCEKASKFFELLKDSVSKYPASMSVFGDKADPSLNRWISDSGDMMRAISGEIRNVTLDPCFSEKLTNEITYLESFKSYLLLDMEFDMLMWAQHHCEPKFFKKIFRTSYKKLRVIDEIRNVVENSKIELAVAIRERFSQAVSALHEAYVYLVPMIRKFKKSVDDPAFVPNTAGTSWFSDEYAKHTNGWSPVCVNDLF